MCHGAEGVNVFPSNFPDLTTSNMGVYELAGEMKMNILLLAILILI